MLLAKEKDPERWQQEIEPMETHTEARQQRPTWAADQVNVVDFLVDHCKLGSRFDKELVQRVCGILEVFIYTIFFLFLLISRSVHQRAIRFILNLLHYIN